MEQYKTKIISNSFGIFTIKYFEHLNDLEQVGDVRGLLQVIFQPGIPSRDENAHKWAFQETNDELISEIRRIIANNQEVYSNYDITFNLLGGELRMIRNNGTSVILNVTKSLDIREKS